MQNQIFKSNKTKKDLRDFNFKPYRAKKFLEGRIIKNGNRAIFYEPMEALSGVYYDGLNKFFYDYINKQIDQETVNEVLDVKAKQYENFICYVYNQGSIYKTKFWKDVKKSTDKHLKNNEIWNKTLHTLNNNQDNLDLTWPFYNDSWNHLKEGFKM